MKTRVITISAVLMLIGAVGGCGAAKGSDDSSAATKGESSASASAKSSKAPDPTITTGPICGRLDVPALGKVLNAGAGWKVNQALKPGQSYDPYPGAKSKLKSTGWSCDMRDTRSSFFYVLLPQKHYTPATFNATLDMFDTNNDANNKGEKGPLRTICTSDTPAGFGSHVAMRSCFSERVHTAKMSSNGLTFVTIRALYGDQYLMCTGSRNVDSGTNKAAMIALEPQTVSACKSVLAALAK